MDLRQRADGRESAKVMSSLNGKSDTFEEAGGCADGGTEAGSGDGSEGSSLEADRQNKIKVL